MGRTVSVTTIAFLGTGIMGFADGAQPAPAPAWTCAPGTARPEKARAAGAMHGVTPVDSSGRGGRAAPTRS